MYIALGDAGEGLAALFAHFGVERGDASSRGLSDVAEELGEAGVRQAHDELTVARIDPASEIGQGDEAEFWLDVSRLHYFDAESGANLFLQEETEAVQVDESERDEVQEHPVSA